MTYRFTPINIFIAAVAVFCMYSSFIAGNVDGFGVLILLAGPFFAGLVIDFILQARIKSYLWLCIIEVIIIIATIIINNS